jgi:hypothetical protein
MINIPSKFLLNLLYFILDKEMKISINSGSTMLYVNLYLHDICYVNGLIVNGLVYYLANKNKWHIVNKFDTIYPFQALSEDNRRKAMTQTYELAEECLQTNYYGAKITTESLLPLLKLSDSPRIVNVSSTLGQLEVDYFTPCLNKCILDSLMEELNLKSDSEDNKLIMVCLRYN